MIGLRVGIGLVAEIGVTAKVRLAFLRDRVVSTLPWEDTDKTSILELWEATGQSGIGDVDSAVLEVVSNPLVIVARAAVFQKFKDDIITACHPVGSVASHEIFAEEPAKTVFDVLHNEYMIFLSGESLPQQLLRVGNHFTTTVSAMPLGASSPENGNDARGSNTGIVLVGTNDVN